MMRFFKKFFKKFLSVVCEYPFLIFLKTMSNELGDYPLQTNDIQCV